LTYDRAAGGQRRSALASDHRGGKVPGRDRGADADRMLGDQDAAVGQVWLQDFALNPLGLFGVELDKRRRVIDLAACLGDRLALFGRQDRGQCFAMFAYQVEPAAQHGGTVGCQCVGPWCQSSVSSSNGVLGGLLAEVGNASNRFAGRWIHDRIVGVADPVAVDVGLLFDQRRRRRG